ncbi:MAG: hypothetical protein P8Y47_08925, partial [Alphaproteobacteria bacterium]
EQSLVALQYHWQNFMARDDKRMLVWQFKENALRLVDVFFKVQQEERLSEKPYVSNETFIIFDQPFENSVSYAETLKKDQSTKLPVLACIKGFNINGGKPVHLRVLGMGSRKVYASCPVPEQYACDGDDAGH